MERSDGRATAHRLPVPGELDAPCLLSVRPDGMDEHEPDWLVLGASSGPGDPGHGDTDVCAEALPHTVRHCLGDLGGDRSVALEKLGGTPSSLSFTSFA